MSGLARNDRASNRRRFEPAADRLRPARGCTANRRAGNRLNVKRIMPRGSTREAHPANIPARARRSTRCPAAHCSRLVEAEELRAADGGVFSRPATSFQCTAPERSETRPSFRSPLRLLLMSIRRQSRRRGTVTSVAILTTLSRMPEFPNSTMLRGICRSSAAGSRSGRCPVARSPSASRHDHALRRQAGGLQNRDARRTRRQAGRYTPRLDDRIILERG